MQHSGLILSHFYEQIFLKTPTVQNSVLILLYYYWNTLHYIFIDDYVQRHSLVLYCRGNFLILHMIKGNYKTNSDKIIVFELTV